MSLCNFIKKLPPLPLLICSLSIAEPSSVVVRFYNESRRVAGNRWQVTVRYDAVVSASETFWSQVSGEPKLIEEIRAALGAEIVPTKVNERNFNSAEEKEALVAEIIIQARENIFGYLADPGFPECRFKRCFKGVREEIDREKRGVWVRTTKILKSPLIFHIFFRCEKERITKNNSVRRSS